MPRQKLPKRPKRLPKVASEAPSLTQEPSKPSGGTPVALNPVGPLDGQQFDRVWESLSPRQKAKVRMKASEWGYTLRGVLNRWPELRQG